MKKIKYFFKNNKIIFIMLFVILIIMCYCFFDLFKSYYSYDYDYEINLYNETMIKCDKGEIGSDICDIYDKPLMPMDKLKNNGAQYVFISVLNEKFSGIMVLGLPIVIFIMLYSKIFDKFSSGSIRNYLIRESFKKFKFDIDKIIIKLSLLVPLFLFALYFFSCIVTGFNFDVSTSSSVVRSSYYDPWIINNIFLYLVIHYFILVFVCIFYGNIACIFVNKSKKKIISLFYSLLTLCALFTLSTKLQGLAFRFNINSFIPHIDRYLNILDFFTFYNLESNIYGHLIVAITLAILSFFTKNIILRNKEKVLIENEKGII